MNIFNVNYNEKTPKNFSQIFFGMGCFWGAEKKFWNISGLYTTVVGYAGGHTRNPTYEEVCTGTTGHAEVVKVIYDKQSSLEDVLKIFWESHDPTQLNRQGNDIGSQYRSIILSDKLKIISEIKKSKERFEKKVNLHTGKRIRTEIKLLEEFFVAEEYHQKYLHKNPNGYCGLKSLGIDYS